MKRTLALIGALAAGPAFAGGFALSTQSAEAVGLAGAVTARPNSTSSAFYNPSMAAGQEGTRLAIGGIGIATDLRVGDTTGPDGSRLGVEKAVPGVRPAPHVLLAMGLGDAAFTLYLGAPYGSGVAYDPTWRGRYEVTDISLRALSVNANLAYKVTPYLSVAAGYQGYSATIELKRQADLIDDELGVHLGGAGRGHGFTASATLRPRKDVNVALSYRSAVHIPLTGQVDFQNVPTPFGFRTRDQDIKSSVTLPDRIVLGTHFQVSSVLALSLDLEYYRWSTFKELAFDFEDDALDRAVPRNWQDSLTPRIGVEYKMNKYVTARGGMYVDPSVSPQNTMSPSSPDADRIAGAIGVSGQFGYTTVDLGYTYIHLIPRLANTSPFPAEYSGAAQLFGLTLAQQF